MSHKELLSGFTTVNSTAVHPARLTSVLLSYLYFLLFSFLSWVHDDHLTITSSLIVSDASEDTICVRHL